MSMEIENNYFFNGLLSYPSFGFEKEKIQWNGREIRSLKSESSYLAKIVQNAQGVLLNTAEKDARCIDKHRSYGQICENPTVTELLDEERYKRECRNIGTIENPDGSIGSDPRVDAIAQYMLECSNLEGKLEELKQYAIQAQLDSVREKIEILQRQEIQLQSEAGLKILAYIGEAAAVAGALVAPPLAVIGFVTACYEFYGWAEKYGELLGVRNEIEQMIKLERSLDKNKEQEKLNELRAK